MNSGVKKGKRPGRKRNQGSKPYCKAIEGQPIKGKTRGKS